MGRHYRGMKTVLCLSLFFAACAFADETADRAAIGSRRALRRLPSLGLPPENLMSYSSPDGPA